MKAAVVDQSNHIKAVFCSHPAGSVGFRNYARGMLVIIRR